MNKNNDFSILCRNTGTGDMAVCNATRRRDAVFDKICEKANQMDVKIKCSSASCNVILAHADNIECVRSLCTELIDSDNVRVIPTPDKKTSGMTTNIDGSGRKTRKKRKIA